MTETTATILTAEEITALQKELEALRAFKSGYANRHDRMRNTLREASNQLSYLILTMPDGLSVCIMESQAAGLCTILEYIQNDVDEVFDALHLNP